VAFTRLDLEQRRAKAAALERQVYPDHTRVLSKEEYEAFFDRLMADTARRAQHRRAGGEGRRCPLSSLPHPPATFRRLFVLSCKAVRILTVTACPLCVQG
jgi:hypothetical protein